MLFLACISLCIVACDKDEPTGPGNSTSKSEYGEIKPTGLKMVNLYEPGSKDGPTELKIPGFPPLHCSWTGYWSDELGLISDGGGLLDCGITESMNSFKWTETNKGFTSSVKLTNNKVYDIYHGKSIIYRVKISKADEYPERFAYARIRFIDALFSNDGMIIGCTLEYDSPYTPL